MKSLKSISDELWDDICLSSGLFGILIIKECVEFSQVSFAQQNKIV